MLIKPVSKPRREKNGVAMQPPEKRLWALVVKTRGCWLWSGGVDKDGYGHVSRGRRGAGFIKAHRLSYEIHVGPIPVGLLVLHSCDTPACVRPDHLFVGTQADNMRDAATKRRTTIGDRHGRAKLTAKQANALRNEKGLTQRLLAIKYGIGQAQVSRILTGKRRGREV